MKFYAENEKIKSMNYYAVHVTLCRTNNHVSLNILKDNSALQAVAEESRGIIFLRIKHFINVYLVTLHISQNI